MHKRYYPLILLMLILIVTLSIILFFAIKANHRLQRQILIDRIDNSMLPKYNNNCATNFSASERLVIPDPKCGKVAKSPDEKILSDLKWKNFDFYSISDIAILLGDKEGEILDTIDSDVKFPAEFPRAAAEVIFSKGSMNDKKQGCYALFDLNDDGLNEIFVTRGVGMNGLGGVSILEKKKNKWREIYYGSANLILHKRTWFEKRPEDSRLDHSYFYITEWHYDAHKYWQLLSAYNGHKYQLINGQGLPWAIAGSYSFRSMFWEISYSCR